MISELIRSGKWRELRTPKYTPDQWTKLDAIALKACDYRTSSLRLLRDKASLTLDTSILANTTLSLPITHSDVPADKVKDPVWLEAAGRRVGERLEKSLLGVDNLGPGECQADGLCTAPGRITKILQGSFGDELYAAITLLKANKFYGPYIVLHGNSYDRWLDQDANDPEPVNRTVRQKLLDTISTVSHIQRADLLSAKTIIVVQATNDVIRVVDALRPIVFEHNGGLKVAAIQVVQSLAEGLHALATSQLDRGIELIETV